MANGRAKGSRGDAGRDGGGFVALPWSVLDCPAYARLSHPARALLLEFARQFVRDNNGRMLASAAYLGKRGWKSADVITRAKRELLAAGFIFETVQGHRPNKASWYAVTWRTLDKLPGYDVGAAQCFERGAYQKNVPLKNAGLIPVRGVDSPAIAPAHGVASVPPTPLHGAIKPTIAACPTPAHGNHLETPSLANQTDIERFSIKNSSKGVGGQKSLVESRFLDHLTFPRADFFPLQSNYSNGRTTKPKRRGTPGRWKATQTARIP